MSRPGQHLLSPAAAAETQHLMPSSHEQAPSSDDAGPCGLSLSELIDQTASSIGLRWLACARLGHQQAAVPAPDPVDQVGYLNLIHPHRIQVLGSAEVAYFERLSSARRDHILDELGHERPPALIAADGIDPPAALVEGCERMNLPLLATALPGARAIELLRRQLAKSLALTCTRHGVMMDVLGVGVLISGESGLGKSELGLELISRGHGLVADDVVELHRIGTSTIEGRCPSLLQGLLEVRGLGLLDIKTVFGETAVRRKMRLKLIVHLVRRSTHEDEYERLPLEDLTEEVLGLKIRKVVIPVAAGRNLAVLAEAAVRNTILQLRGIDTMREFIARQQRAIQDAGLEHQPPQCAHGADGPAPP
jgi:HPr kinase/phosphorylase